MRSYNAFVLVMALMTMEAVVVQSQFGYGFRNLFGVTSREIAVDPTCAADGMPCLRMTDCCSGWCQGYSTYDKCQPSTCGCRQPPWNKKPIYEICKRNDEESCLHHEECCSGFCERQPYIGPFGRARAPCAMPPCRPCSLPWI